MKNVVKCNQCGQHFMHTEKDTPCPFCHTEYIEVKAVVEVAEEKPKDLPAQAGKKGAAKTQKKPFKLWKDS